MSPIEGGRSYKIDVDTKKLETLRKKLELTVLPDEVEDASPWSRGAPLGEIHRLLSYWKDGFDWRKAEAKLNEMPQEIVNVEIDGFGTCAVHCVHQKSEVKNAIPLLFAHGWPGSFIEITKLLPLLVKGGERGPAFHVVAPSLLNFGFSDGVAKPGFNGEKHAEACHKMMVKLGYPQYVAQGGDIGYYVVRFLAAGYPKSCKAHHINMVAAQEPSEEKFPELAKQIKSTELTAAEGEILQRTQMFFTEGVAYAQMHSTRPQTLAYSMVDSPVGLLAWIYEKLHAWTDEYPWTDDEILTWISIYALSKAGAHASQRYYYDSSHCQPMDQNKTAEYVDVKLGISRFPKEIVNTPRLWAHSLGPVVLDKTHEKGGHFAAWECPEALAGDLKEMFGRDGGAFGVVEGCNGYKE